MSLNCFQVIEEILKVLVIQALKTGEFGYSNKDRFPSLRTKFILVD